jgi:hypothetical protein
MKDKLGSFVSKKLIALIVGVIALAVLGETEMVKQLVMTYIGAQGAVDVVAALKKKIGG